ncbi:hypothetical protein [Desulfovibrio sp. JC022]|uniref:hypothetical protein n=1 Tax=Desulfovibrio sp. JC022 TaxID=2593642 RepID=UPI0013D095BD|nr:hypothetical protein [Desulfovibrio sp. JC022]NDV22594.1 hypothetical protein [Desulfovibrio sp. JC022]
MAPQQGTPGALNPAKRTLLPQALFILLLLLNTSLAGAALSSQRPKEQSARNINLEFHRGAEKKTTDANVLLPRLAPIPNKEEVTPQKADEIKPSTELKEIIERVKNGTLPKYSNKTTTKFNYSVSEEDLLIIKSGGRTLKAEEVSPSPALKAVLEAYRNGSLDYTQRDIREVEEELFYHQPYAEMNMASVYDLVMLQTGRDVFLSLDYQPLSKNGKNAEELRSRRIKDLKLTITAIKFKEKQKQGEETDEHGEQHKKSQVKIKIKPKETFARKVLNMLGIRRKDEAVDYEKLSKTYRAYKRWSEHVKDVDEMLRRKRRRKIMLIQQRRYRPSKKIDCSDPAFRGICPDGQLKIDPYKKGNIRFLKP